MSSSSTPAPPSEGVVDRIQSFVSENRRAVLLGAALTVAAIGGFAYYASTSRPSQDGDAEKGDRKRGKKKGKLSKKPKSEQDEDGPLLEEAEPKDKRPSYGTTYLSFIHNFARPIVSHGFDI